MWTLTLRRLFDVLLVVWVVGTLTFVLLHIAPGDPISAQLSDARIAPATRAHWRAVYALDQPLWVQYARYVRSLASGDMGFSFSQNRPVLDALREVMPYSMLLTLSALLLGAGVGAGVGTWSAIARTSRVASAASNAVNTFAALPEVWLALCLLAVFSAQLAWFPMSGRCDALRCGTDRGWLAITDLLKHLALPTITLALTLAAPFSRVQRVALLTVLHDDVMRTAHAKGMSTARVLWRHGIRRCFQPLLVSVALSLPVVAGGAVFVERVFSWPGMGALLVQSIAVRDYPMVTAIAALAGVCVCVGRWMTELIVELFDPLDRLANDT